MKKTILLEQAFRETEEASRLLRSNPFTADDCRKALAHTRSANSLIQSLERLMVGVQEPKIGD